MNSLNSELISRADDDLQDAHLVALHEVVQAVSRRVDSRAALALVAEKALALTGASSAAVTLLDSTRTLLDFTAVAGGDAGDILGQTIRVSDSLAGQTALSGEVHLSHNPHATGVDAGMGWGVRSALVVPIFLAGQPAGALAALNRADGESFGGGDLLRLQMLANLAALALGAEELRQRAARKQRERDILYEAARSTSSSLNVQEVLSRVLATVSDSLEMTSGAVFLLNDERTRLYIGAERGLSDEDRDRQLAVDGGLAGQALASGQPRRIDDALQGEGLEDLPLPGMRSLILAPMLARSASEGLLVVGSRQAGAYSGEDASLLSAVAGQAAVALENAWLYEDAMRRAQEATAIYELSQAVGATLDLKRVLHFVADSVLSLLHVDRFALFLHDPRAGCLDIKVARNLRRETAQAMQPRSGEGIAGWVFEFETPTAVQDVAADHRNRSCPIDAEGVTSLVSVPLQAGDQVIGVLQAMSSRRRLFTVGEMELLYTIANQVGASIVNAQMYEEARQRTDEIRKGVRRVARALGSSLQTPQTAQVIADLALEMTGADRSVLLLSDPRGRLLPRAAANFRSALGAIPPGEGGREGESPGEWVARRGRSLAVEVLHDDSRFHLPPYATPERVSGYLGVPLKLGPNVLGVLEVYTREPRRFRSDEMRLLITFASQAAVGLQNALLVEQAGRRVADLAALNALSDCLCAALPLEELLAQALRLMGEGTQADAGLLSGFDVAALEWGMTDAGAEAALRDLAASPIERDSAEAAGAVPILAVRIPTAPTVPALGAILLARGASRPAFDAHDRQLVTTAANLLAARLH